VQICTVQPLKNRLDKGPRKAAKRTGIYHFIGAVRASDYGEIVVDLSNVNLWISLVLFKKDTLAHAAATFALNAAFGLLYRVILGREGWNAFNGGVKLRIKREFFLSSRRQ